MSNLYPFAKLLWSLTASGGGTTLSAAGNSGNWAGNGPGHLFPQVSAETPIDLRDSTASPARKNLPASSSTSLWTWTART